MRKTVFFILCFLLIGIAVHAGMSTLFFRGTSEEECSTSNDILLYDKLNVNSSSVYNDYVCTKFTTDADGETITEYIALLCDRTQAGANVTVSLWSHNGGSDQPNANIPASDAVLADSAITDCGADPYNFQEHAFTLGTPYEAAASTIFWVCRRESTASTRMSRDETATGERYCYSVDGSSWTCANNIMFNFEVWGCD